jgi:decaprenyl-phosphate phosphoribosyltransferase
MDDHEKADVDLSQTGDGLRAVGGPSTVHVLGAPARRFALAGAILTTARPRQWAKNVLVFGAPATAGVLLDREPLVAAVAAFVAFCFVSSGVYFLNDVVDVSSDLQHPTKRLRPVATGAIPRALAIAIGSFLIASGMAVGVVGAGAPLLGVLAGYVGLSFAYMFLLRDIALLDLAAIAGGFLLRAVAGGVATDVPLSMWFLMVAGFGSLFLAAGKRHAEFVQLGEERARHRKSLSEYSELYLRFIQYSASTVAMTAYSLWAFEGAAGGSLWSGLSIIPFVLGILRYALLLDKGRGAVPEEAVLTDPPLLVLGLSWVLLVVMGVYIQ